MGCRSAGHKISRRGAGRVASPTRPAHRLPSTAIAPITGFVVSRRRVKAPNLSAAHFASKCQCGESAGAPSVPNVQIGMPRHRGPRVRIQFPPAQSLVRTFPSGSDRRNPPINRRQGRIGSCGPSTGRSEQRRPAREKTRRRCSARPRWSRRRCSNTTSSAPPVSATTRGQTPPSMARS